MKSGIRKANASSIPCSIHQTWKTNDVEQLPSWVASSVMSFKTMNPECSHTLWSDADVASFMETKYPQLQEAFVALRPVERADIFRYAVVHSLGGFYSDVDVTCRRPIKDWGIPRQTELVVGYETGRHLSEKERQDTGFIRTEQFEQWTFGATAGHPALKKCLELFEEKREWGIENTLELTGPALFSDAVHEFLWKYGHPKPIGAVDGDAAALAQSEASKLRFPSGDGPDGSKTWIFSADQVASPGYSAGDSEAHLLVRHGFRGTWKEPGMSLLQSSVMSVPLA
jgi:hypothetical protein